MKSKTMALNLGSLISNLILLLGALSADTHLAPMVLTCIIVANVILSEIYANFFPSGTFAGSGQNWNTAKWIANIALVVLAILQQAQIVTLIPEQITVIAVPIIQMVMRYFGGATQAQQAAAK